MKNQLMAALVKLQSINQKESSFLVFLKKKSVHYERPNIIHNESGSKSEEEEDNEHTKSLKEANK